MPNWKDLLNAESYSEGDPVRQLFGAASAVKDWPVDALALGADLVDLSSSGLAKILARRPELANAVKTDLGGNLRRAFAPEGYGRPTMTEGPAPDIEEGRSVGRMLNPLLWAGNQKIPTPALKQFSPKRREFLTKVAEAHKAAEKAAESGSILDTPMTRRDFNKGLATAAVAAPAAGLLYKFGKGKQALEAAPELARVAEVAPKAAEGGAYKYNSLKEYIDDVIATSTEATNEFVTNWQHTGYTKGLPSELIPWNNSKEFDEGIDAFYKAKFKDRLLNDENRYNEAKSLKETYGHPEIDHISSYESPEEFIKYGQALDKELNKFSPQAKQEMKALKELHGDDWVSYEPDFYYDNMGIIQGRPQYNFDGSPRMSNEFYWNGTKKLDNQFEHLNPRSPGYNFWDETGTYGLQDGAKSATEMRELFKKYIDEWL